MNREWMRDPGIGTLGGGNHFAEFQVVSKIIDKQKAFELGLKVGSMVCMIHTGSRDVGHYIGQTWMDRAKSLYPIGIKHPKNGIYAIEGDMTGEYISAMHSAAHYATTNRALISEIIRQRIIEVYKTSDNRLITDVPHNIILQESIGNVHRKGATPAYEDQPLLIPGSMGHDSYLMNGLGNSRWLSSASHGAGRNYSRSDLHYKAKTDYDSLGLGRVECITLKEERKIEEAPLGYKDIGEVIASQVDEGIMTTIAIFSPVTTFKA
jgi:tRNA-splicing ligase RtcB